MLVKCVCSNCGHSYLADDQAGNLECPRCGVGNDVSGPAPDMAPQSSMDYRQPGGFIDPQDDYDPAGYEPFEEEDLGYQEPRFAPQAPPPMLLTSDRLLKGFLVGAGTVVVVGAGVGAALAAVQVTVPAVLGLAVGLIGGLACRSGFGGRVSSQTKGRAILAVVLAMTLGLGGYVTGSWLVDRFTGLRAEQTREDLESGLHSLRRQRTHTDDAGETIVLEKRIGDTKALLDLSDAQLEDYLWVQEAQLNQPLLAYSKLRATRGPAIQLGPDRDPVDVPPMAIPGILLGEVLLAAFVAARLVSP